MYLKSFTIPCNRYIKVQKQHISSNHINDKERWSWVPFFLRVYGSDGGKDYKSSWSHCLGFSAEKLFSTGMKIEDSIFLDFSKLKYNLGHKTYQELVLVKKWYKILRCFIFQCNLRGKTGRYAMLNTEMHINPFLKSHWSISF